MAGEIRVGTGARSTTAYLARAARPGAAVVVVHDWYGLLPHLRARCEALARIGITALAPDLYDGASARDHAGAGELFAALDADLARLRLAASVTQLRGGGARRVGLLGYSSGGWLALLAARTSRVEAVVAYYAALETDEWEPLESPVQFHFAGVDDWDPPEAPEAYAEWLRAAGCAVEGHRYPTSRHGFANADVADFDPGAHELAWDRTVTFLQRQLVVGEIGD